MIYNRKEVDEKERKEAEKQIQKKKETTIYKRYLFIYLI